MDLELHRDVGIIVVQSPFIINEFVHPACLPTKSVLTGRNCYASGWGDTSDYKGSPNSQWIFSIDILGT